MNRLADQGSPYLRQHAGNPVDWYPWGPEATAEAVRSDRPILLSVGYSACHWCHVMAHESFEDPATAELMNRLFVNVKVDREERPDVDALYMDAVQAISGHGGWPMTVFLTPGGEPFFAGTYFPPEPRHNMPGFGQLLEAIGRAWTEEREVLVSQAERVTGLLRRVSARPVQPEFPEREILHRAAARLVSHHDPVDGGFGSAPKFPNPFNLDVLLRHHLATGDTESLRAVTTTLDRMAAGGIYDHLGGGFARYSTDARWAVPHFEKMLYDNALLAGAYLHGWQVTGDADYAQVVVETIAYVLTDLRLAGGGFASAEDADSEGEEGRFYVWTLDEVTSVVSGQDLAAATQWYGVAAAGNFEGANVLHRPEPGRLARPAGVARARAALLAARSQRVRPGLDDKVLTEWNGLMISALAEAGAAMDRTDWIETASQAAEFLLANLRDGDGRWYRSWQAEGTARHPAYAEDYAALLDAFTRLGTATGQARWHQLAVETADAMIELFWDGDAGGLFTTGRDADELLIRRKELYDGVTPSANASAAMGLLQVAALHGRADLAGRAEQILRLVAADELGEQPQAHGRMLAALDLATASVTEIVVAGERPDLVGEVWRRYRPNAVLAWGEPFASPLWENREADAAYVCRDYTCQLPAATADELRRQLSGGS